MRPIVFGIALVGAWTLLAAGVIANLAGVSGVGNPPIVLVPVPVSLPEAPFDASVPLAEVPSVRVEQSAL